MDFLDKVKKMSIPVLLLINKIDESYQTKLGDIVEKWHALLPNAEILPISAKNKFGTDMLFETYQGVVAQNRLLSLIRTSSLTSQPGSLCLRLSERRFYCIIVRRFLIL